MYIRYQGQRQARNSHQNSWANVSTGPLLSILPGGPTAAQIANPAGLTTAGGVALTWTRSTAGYVDTGAAFDASQLLAYPDTIAGFNTSSATITKAFATGPDGVGNADRIVASGGPNQFVGLVDQPVAPAIAGLTTWSGQTVTIGAWVRATSATCKLAFRMTWSSVVDLWSPDITATAAWQYVTFTQTYPANASTTSLSVGFSVATTLAAYDVEVAGMKLQLGGSSTPYVRPPLVSLAANIARVGPLGLLVESAATNLCLQSQSLDNAAWTATAATVTANALIAPDGTLTAETIAWTGSGNGVQSTGVTAVAAKYTASILVNKVSGAAHGLTLAIVDVTASVDLATVTVNTSTLSTWTGISCTLPSNATAGNTIAVALRGLSGRTDAAWGAQLETGTAPSSYFPTTTTSATRSADVGTVANPLTSMAMLTLKAKVTPYGTWNDGVFHGILALGPFAAHNTFSVYMQSAAKLQVEGVDNSGADQFISAAQPTITDATHSIAGAKNGGAIFQYALDGVVTTPSVAGGPLGTMTVPTNLYLGNNNSGNQLNGYLRDIAVYSSVVLP